MPQLMLRTTQRQVAEKCTFAMAGSSQTNGLRGPLTKRRMQRPAIGEFRMTSDAARTMLRNKLLGRWAAESLFEWGIPIACPKRLCRRGFRNPAHKDRASRGRPVL